jgi:molybdenum cofactor synthesis domain-containing protein
MRVGVLTVSDRVSAGSMEDRGGPAVEAALDPAWEVARREVVPDERERIAAVLIAWTDNAGLDLIFTTGGTGLSPRDVTPEATARVCHRLIPGMAEVMRAAGLAQTPMAMISRAIVGVRGTTIIVNLPGSPRGATEGVQAVMPVLEHAVATLRGGTH